MSGHGGFADLVGPGAILIGLKVASKDALFEELAAAAATVTGLPATTIVERVRERESLGATGFGQGAAIPHARLAGLDAVTAVVAHLAAGVDYGALDTEAVDVVVLLLSPESAGADHLKALAKVSRALRDPDTVAAMRAAGDAQALRAVIGGALVGQHG
ncbi:PTS sugar transporter subunit IIA [Sandarakinorhabdus sp. DWP1-3-1]|uniref:PTS sugar transporter subunit IIA n=1 Tax=Sandarakinorhabdus sp. DWP1-3-1 TaxID=2804627 RepID=UPI003CFB9EDA